MNDYLLKIKQSVDSLTSVDYFVPIDQIETIFDVLPPDYEPVLLLVTSRPETQSVE